MGAALDHDGLIISGCIYASRDFKFPSHGLDRHLVLRFSSDVSSYGILGGIY
jgi:hypothetical protein